MGDSTLFHTIANTLEVGNFSRCEAASSFEKKILRLQQPNWGEPRFLSSFRDLVNQLSIVANKVPEDRKPEIVDHRDRILATYNGILESLDLERDDHVYWLEVSGKSGQNVNIQCAPIDIAAIIETSFHKNGGKNRDKRDLERELEIDEAFAEKAGVNRGDISLRASPFNYEKNSTIYIATDVPEPSFKTKGSI